MPRWPIPWPSSRSNAAAAIIKQGLGLWRAGGHGPGKKNGENGEIGGFGGQKPFLLLKRNILYTSYLQRKQ
jgi:hypothetical protein